MEETIDYAILATIGLFLICHTTNFYLDFAVFNLNLICQVFVIILDYKAYSGLEPISMVQIIYQLSSSAVILSIVIISTYVLLKKLYDIFVRSHVERKENNKLLELIDEGLLIVNIEAKG